MRRYAAVRVSVRRAAELLVGVLAIMTPAIAGDRALIDPIGFSEDGRYFAFEEFGIQDGSGFAYSSIYVVDLPADKWTYGSPFRAQAAEEAPDTPLAAVRAEAMGKAGDKLGPLGIAVPAEILVLVGDGVGGGAKSLSWSTPRCCGPGETEDAVLTLSLDTFPAGSPQDCAGLIGHKALGYALQFTEAGQTSELHRDGATLPRSRGCPLDYRLHAVLAPFGQGRPLVAILSVYPFGFEGPDRRFLAVPIQ
jgi:predicted secreted protein